LGHLSDRQNRIEQNRIYKGFPLTDPMHVSLIICRRIQKVQVLAQIQPSLAQCLKVPLMEQLYKKTLRFRKLFYMSLVDLNIGDLPPDSLYRAFIERDVPLPKAPLACLLESPVK